MQVAADFGTVGQYFIERIDDAIAYIELTIGFGRTYTDAHFVGIAAQFYVFALASVVNIGEAVDAHTVALGTFQEFH